METKNLHPFALRKLPHDARDLRFGSLFTLKSAADLPLEFETAEPLKIKDQKASDYCGAFSSTSVSEDQETVELDPLWQFMKTKVLEGDPQAYGTDLRYIGKSFTKFGSIEAKDSPYTVDTPRETIVDPSSWRDKNYDELSLAHQKSSFAFVTPDFGMDFFDTLRSTMFHGDKQSVAIGMAWCAEWLGAAGGVVASLGTVVSGHAVKLYGWKQINGEPYIKVQLSNGKNIGDQGIFYFSRVVINSQQEYGAIVFTKYDADWLKRHQALGVKVDQNWIVRIISLIIAFFTKSHG